MPGGRRNRTGRMTGAPEPEPVSEEEKAPNEIEPAKSERGETKGSTSGATSKIRTARELAQLALEILRVVRELRELIRQGKSE